MGIRKKSFKDGTKDEDFEIWCDDPKPTCKPVEDGQFPDNNGHVPKEFVPYKIRRDIDANSGNDNMDKKETEDIAKALGKVLTPREARKEVLDNFRNQKPS